MSECFIWELLDGQHKLAQIFRLLFSTPSWWYCAPAEYEERDIVEYYLPRDPQWLRVDLPCHIARMHRIALALLREPFMADEAVAMALMQTERVPYVPDNLGAYLDCAVRSAAFDILRHRQRNVRLVSLDDIFSHYEISCDFPSPEEEAWCAERSEILHSAIVQLSAVEQQAVELHYFEDLSIRETASALGVTVFSAQNILSRSRKKLFNALAPKMICQRSGRARVAAEQRSIDARLSHDERGL